MEREQFLANVRAAGANALIPAHEQEGGPLVWSPQGPDLADRFVANLEAVDGIVHRVRDGQVAATVIGLLRHHEASRVLAWADGDLLVAGIRDAVAAAEMDLVDPSVPGDPTGRLNHQIGYDGVGAGITGAAAGLAESGSLVLASGPGRSRMASLIPPVHIAIVRASTIHASLSHYAAAHPDAARTTANLVIITGPSRTGDIETHLNLGVHGPRYLYAILIED